MIPDGNIIATDSARLVLFPPLTTVLERLLQQARSLAFFGAQKSAVALPLNIVWSPHDPVQAGAADLHTVMRSGVEVEWRAPSVDDLALGIEDGAGLRYEAQLGAVASAQCGGDFLIRAQRQRVTPFHEKSKVSKHMRHEGEILLHGGASGGVALKDGFSCRRLFCRWFLARHLDGGGIPAAFVNWWSRSVLRQEPGRDDEAHKEGFDPTVADLQAMIG